MLTIILAASIAATPSDDGFISSSPPPKPLAAVIEKLQELNPGFDGKASHRIEKGRITGLSLSTATITDLAPLRTQWLLTKGNPLSRLDAVIDWESFRPLLEAALEKPAKGPGGPRPNDPLKMFKALLVQRFFNLSDEQTEYQVNDRLSFQQFIGWTLADKAPDANTLWDFRRRQRRLVELGFREAWIEAGAVERQFNEFARGCVATGNPWLSFFLWAA